MPEYQRVSDLTICTEIGRTIDEELKSTTRKDRKDPDRIGWL